MSTSSCRPQRRRARKVPWNLLPSAAFRGHKEERRPSTDPSDALGRDALRHADALYNLARYLTGKDADAEDLVQETYARAMSASAGFTPGTNLKAWLFRILRNGFLDSVRRRRREAADATVDTDEVLELAADDSALRGDGELERLRSIVGSEIEAALMSLPTNARTVVLLELEGFTEAEMADVLGCAQGTVKSRLSRARAGLRDRLGDYQREGSR
jgi:RNA polymerase sigma-70 factor, ECF subfamily